MVIDRNQFERTIARWDALRGVRERNLAQIRSGAVLSIDDRDRVIKFLLRRGFSEAEAAALVDHDVVDRIGASEAVGVEEPSGLERVLGVNNLMGVAFLEQGLRAARTVARIWVDVRAGQPSGYGTGFMVSPELMLTNHHVLRTQSVALSSAAEFDYQLTLGGGPATAKFFRLQPERFFTNDEALDYALVAVEPVSAGGEPLDFGWNPMLAEEGKAIEAQWVNIIQHPRGGFKQLAMRESQILTIKDDFLTYTTDTDPGASGSPVYNDRWEVVGLHHSSVPARDTQGRLLDIDGRLWTSAMSEDRLQWIANEGVRTSRIVAHLRQLSLPAGKKALLDAMLAATPPSGPHTPPLEIRAAQVPSQPIAETAFRTDGQTATWTIPLTVSVTLGGQGGAAVAMAGPTLPPPAAAAIDDFELALARARTALGGRRDVLKIEAGFKFVDGWITRTPAIVVTVARKQPQATLEEAGVTPLPRRIDGFDVEVVQPTIENLLAGRPALATTESLGLDRIAQEIVYTPPQGVALDPVDAQMKVTVSASPDHGWPLLKDFLGDAKKTLTVGMYDLGAPHITGALIGMGGKPSFRKLQLAIQLAGRKPGSALSAENQAIDEIDAALGTKFDLSRIQIGAQDGWVATSYHIKVAVRDSKAFWLSSGNWQKSNQPDVDPANEASPSLSWLTKGNRDWHVVIEHEGLAKTFERYLDHDFIRNRQLAGGLEAAAPEMPDVLVPEPLLEPDAREAAGKRYFKPFTKAGRVKVRPLLTPDNFHGAVMDLVGRARESLLIQNQTFSAPKAGQAQLTALLDRIVEKQRSGVDVRIIFRLISADEARANLTALQQRGFDMGRIRLQRNCHTKGVIVDGAHLLVGSQNWSQLGITDNRDASLWFEDADIAAYFGEMFEHDWTHLAKADIGPSVQPLELAGPERETPPGYQRLTWKEFAEIR